MTADNVTPFPQDGPPNKQELEAMASAINEAGKAANKPQDAVWAGSALVNGVAQEAVLPPQGPPPALTPAKIEHLMARFFQEPDMVARAAYVRTAGLPDEGLPDLGPLAQVVLQCTRHGGPEAQGITFMYAAYGLWCYHRDHVAKEGK